MHSVAFACFVSMITLPDIRTILFISHISLCIFHMQPGYLHNLIPDSAPHHPESLQNILNGEVIQSVSYNLKLLGKKEKKIILLAQLCMQLIIQSLCGIKNYFITQAKLNCIVNFL